MLKEAIILFVNIFSEWITNIFGAAAANGIFTFQVFVLIAAYPCAFPLN